MFFEEEEEEIEHMCNTKKWRCNHLMPWQVLLCPVFSVIYFLLSFMSLIVLHHVPCTLEYIDIVSSWLPSSLQCMMHQHQVQVDVQVCVHVCLIYGS